MENAREGTIRKLLSTYQKRQKEEIITHQLLMLLPPATIADLQWSSSANDAFCHWIC